MPTTPPHFVRVARSLALLGPLVASSGVMAQAAPPQPAPQANACPARRPREGARCQRPATEPLCEYPNDDYCGCAPPASGQRTGAWRCFHRGANRGPLPPPELAQA